MLKTNRQAFAAIIIATLGAAPAFADNAEIEALKKQTQMLIKQQEILLKRIQELEKPKPAVQTGNSLQQVVRSSTRLKDAIVLSGVVEVEAGYSDHDTDGSSSDLVVATVELGLEAQLTDNISASIVALYEEDDTDLEIDVATITLDDLAGTGIALTLGQDYLPFGAFDTNLVNDTLVLEAAETRETAALLSWEAAGFSASVFVFNGDADGGSDTLENFGASIGWGNDNINLAADYTSNLFDSDGFGGFIEDNAANGFDDIDEAEGAYIVRAALNLESFSFLAEYLGAEESTIPTTTWINRELEVLHTEMAVALGDWTLALAYQETDDAEDFLPEERISFGVTTAITDNIGIGIEYWKDEDYDGLDSDNLVVQLNTAF
ncbi:MAG: LbtU family siderophore porin [Porticoccaceae bacterium]|nr:LbtU family siderophore porin [Pseudomonadales bacterium]MCP5301933.1 LbtU family siderophore porin [Pseudomonadales bacterium]